MTWQDPGANPAPGGPGGSGDDETRPDWDLAGLDALVGDGGGEAGSSAAQPAAPGSAVPTSPVTGATPVTPPGPPADAPPAPPAAPGYGYGAAPVHPQASASGMTWAPPPTERRTGMAYGGTFERVVAYFVDGVVMTLISFLIYVPAAMAGFGPFANLATDYSWSYGVGYGTLDVSTVVPDAGAVAVWIVMAMVSAAISAAYFVFQWSGPSRATLGMRILRLQIGDAADGRTITRGQAFKRWFALGGWTGILSAIPLISGAVSFALFAWELALLITTASSPTKQGLHDRFAGTAVVAPSGDSGNGVVIGCVLIIAAIIVMVVIAFVALVFIGSQVSGILSTIGESV